jgi:hypothetical protein
MEDPHIRASDAERDKVAERLGEACAHGRLDTSELGERLEAAYAARTVRELQALVVFPFGLVALTHKRRSRIVVAFTDEAGGTEIAAYGWAPLGVRRGPRRARGLIPVGRLVKWDQEVAALGYPRPRRDLDHPPQVALAEPGAHLAGGLGGSFVQHLRRRPEQRLLAVGRGAERGDLEAQVLDRAG